MGRGSLVLEALLQQIPCELPALRPVCPAADARADHGDVQLAIRIAAQQERPDNLLEQRPGTPSLNPLGSEFIQEERGAAEAGPHARISGTNGPAHPELFEVRKHQAETLGRFRRRETLEEVDAKSGQSRYQIPRPLPSSALEFQQQRRIRV